LCLVLATASPTLELELVLMALAAGLVVLGWTALAVAVVRLMLVRATAMAAVRTAGLPDFPARLLWMGLISQAGITLGMAAIVASEFPAWGAALQTLVVALTGLHVLAGPILFRAALARAGEIGALDEPALAEAEGLS
jgi:hypothetical protein